MFCKDSSERQIKELIYLVAGLLKNQGLTSSIHEPQIFSQVNGKSSSSGKQASGAPTEAPQLYPTKETPPSA